MKMRRLKKNIFLFCTHKILVLDAETFTENRIFTITQLKKENNQFYG